MFGIFIIISGFYLAGGPISPYRRRRGLFEVPEALERLHREAPQIITKKIPGDGHGLTIVQEELVNRLVLDFLRRDF